MDIKRVWQDFRALCGRIRTNPNRTAALCLSKWTDATRDSLRLEAALRETQTRVAYLEEIMPRPKRAKSSAAPSAAVEAAQIPEAADPLAGLDGPVADPLGALEDGPEDTTPVSGLDGLAEGVTQEAIEAAIRGVTGGGSSGSDAVVAKAILDLKTMLEKVSSTQEVLNNRLVVLSEITQKGFGDTAQRMDALTNQFVQSISAVQAGVGEIMAYLEEGEEAEEGTSAPAPVAAPTAPKPTPAKAESSPILTTCLEALVPRKKAAYAAAPAVWEALSQVCGKAGIQATPEEVEAAFKADGRVKDGKVLVIL
jgi:hypothetical protein